MVYFSPATKEITAKIVFYGPGMCGKTTNLQKVHELMRPQMKSELVSVATETDRTIASVIISRLPVARAGGIWTVVG